MYNKVMQDLKSIIMEEVEIDEEAIRPEATLVGDLGINSLELADLILLCEDKFNVVIDDEEIRNFNTVGDVVRYLEKESA